MGLTRDEILERGRPRSEEVEIRGLGKVAVVKCNSVEAQAFSDMWKDKDVGTRRRAMAWLIARCTLDEPYGERLFTSDEDVESLAKLDADIIEDWFLKVRRYNDLDAEAVKRAGKDSSPTPTSALASDSPSSSESLSDDSTES